MVYERIDGPTHYLLFPNQLTIHAIENNRLVDTKKLTSEEIAAELESGEWTLR
ncbi:hypothetical protein [Exiguobacterium sp. AB2]|uniref:hypothetical protein n=1 Tax=Exiguobacterium sp. AB2 TaxID=1484479 RepID=UPI000A74E9DE|nr:hypothetical protein [Exiguobacterium sp. AB2]